MITAAAIELPREAELLLCFARLTLRTAERARSRQLLEGVLDWQVLLELAATHGLGPLLHKHLDAMNHVAVPNDVFARTWCSYEMAAQRNRTMAAELSRVTALLESNGIPAVAYKGPTLAVALYRDLALRQFGDLDILLRPPDIPSAIHLLLASGYSAEYDLKPSAQSALLRSKAHYHVALIHDDCGISVELHWKSDADYPVESFCADRLWGSSAVPGSGRHIPVPELLLILCLHGSKHHWARLAWLVDIAELIGQHPELDWTRVQQMAQALGAQRRLALGLDLAHRLLGVQAPAQLLGSGATAQVRRVATQIIAAMFSGQSDQTTAAAALALNLALYDAPRQRLRHLWNVVFEPSLLELSRWPLPSALSCLYVPLRLGRLINKYARLLVSGKR